MRANDHASKPQHAASLELAGLRIKRSVDGSRRKGALRSVAVVGLGKLGLPLACLLAVRGCRVAGIDCQAQVVEGVNQGRYTGPEPLVADLLSMAAGRLTAYTDFAPICETEAAFVVVPTPSDADDRFSLEHVLPVVRRIAQEASLACKGTYIIVLVSTVMPGACDRIVLPAIWVASAGHQGGGVELVYAPEFVALGDVVRGMVQPSLVLIGGQSEHAVDRVARTMETIVTHRPAFVRTNFINAETAKLALNALVSTKIACANLLAELCHHLPGADVDAVTRAVGADPRIRPLYLRGGLGFGGPCFPRDVRALGALCRELKVAPRLPDMVSAMNDALPGLVADFVIRCHQSQGVIGILGLAYRAGTGIVEGSHPLKIAGRLALSGSPVHVYDPLVREADCPRLASLKVHFCQDVRSVFEAAATIVIAGQATEFRKLKPAWLGQRTVVDCWRHLPAQAVAEWLSPAGPPGFRYFAWGRGPSDHSGRSPQPGDEEYDEQPWIADHPATLALPGMVEGDVG
jgi:UDPglucose 6-dehydrogenase